MFWQIVLKMWVRSNGVRQVSTLISNGMRYDAHVTVPCKNWRYFTPYCWTSAPSWYGLNTIFDKSVKAWKWPACCCCPIQSTHSWISLRCDGYGDLKVSVLMLQCCVSHDYVFYLYKTFLISLPVTKVIQQSCILQLVPKGIEKKDVSD